MLLDKWCSLISFRISFVMIGFVADKICFDMFCMGSVEMYIKLRIIYVRRYNSGKN